MQTAQELYAEIVVPMPASEQLQLATYILEGLNASGALNYSDYWSDEDIRDLTAYAKSRALDAIGEG